MGKFVKERLAMGWSRWVGGLLSTALLVSCALNSAPDREHLVSGTVECDEVRVASRYGGRVEKLFACEGDDLAPSALIAELSAPELEARLRQARAALDEATSGPRPEEIASAKSEWEALTAELEYARNDARRLRELYQQGTAAKAELEAAESKAAYLERSAEAARKRYELLLAGTRSERIEQARARVAELEAQCAELRVTAPPTSATLEQLPVHRGDVVAPNQEVAVLTLPDSLYVRFYVPATWLSFLSVGQKIMVRPDGRPDKVAEGMIEQIARSAEFTPRNVQTDADRIEQVYAVKVRLPAESWLRAGMTVVGHFQHVSVPPPEYRKSGRYSGVSAQR